MNDALVRVMHKDGKVSTFNTWAEYVADRDLRSWLKRRAQRIAVRDAQRDAEWRSFYPQEA